MHTSDSGGVSHLRPPRSLYPEGQLLASSCCGVRAAEAPRGGACPSLAPVLAVAVGVKGAAGALVAGAGRPAPGPGLLPAGPLLLPPGSGVPAAPAVTGGVDSCHPASALRPPQGWLLHPSPW